MKYAKYTGRRRTWYYMYWYYRVMSRIQDARLMWGDPFAENKPMPGFDAILVSQGTIFNIAEDTGHIPK